MKKIGIITLNANNYGNRLQNYAVQEILKKYGYQVDTIRNRVDVKSKKIFKTKGKIRKITKKIKEKLVRICYKNKIQLREKNFKYFDNKYINYTDFYITANNVPDNFEKKYDFFVTGSDQVWNPNFKRLTKLELLGFALPQQRISLSASFGVNNISDDGKENIEKYLNDFKAISVRETRGKEIIEEVLERKDVTVLLDPTMLLDRKEWEKIIQKPVQKLEKKYIFNYFLGTLSKGRKEEIARVAKENDCEIINILDYNDLFYGCSPAEFLYLEKNAFLICTDSFHSTVFSILFNTPVVVFPREDKEEKMNSRLDTLLEKFDLKNRYYNGKIENDLLKAEYGNVNKILGDEQEKAKEFIETALGVVEE